LWHHACASESGIDATLLPKWVDSCIASSAIGGAVLVGLTVIIAYFGTQTVDALAAFKMFCFIYLIELIFAVLTAWPASLIAGWLKIREGIDVYDMQNTFNPFKF
jgi:hypothetical protein